MSYRRLFVPCLLAVCALACEEAPKPEAKPAASAAPVPTPSAAPAAEPTPAPTPKAAKPKKRLEDCPKGPTVSIDNKKIEAVLRTNLKKPEGDITVADLKKVKLLNISQVRNVEELDVCLLGQM